MKQTNPADLPRFEGRVLEAVVINPSKEGCHVSGIAIGEARSEVEFTGERAFERAGAYATQLLLDEAYRRQDS